MIEKFLDINRAVERVKERCNITDFTKEEVVMDLLEDSAGVKEGKIIYRPYYVAARYLEQDIDRQTLKKAPEVEFTGLTTVIASLMSQQAAIDSSLALIIPAGMEAVVAGEKKTIKRYSYHPPVVPLTTYF